MIEQYLTTEQVANLLQIHPFTVLKFLKNGKIKGIKIGRVYRIKESDVQEFLEKSLVGGSKKINEQSAEKPKIEKTGNSDGKDHYYII